MSHFKLDYQIKDLQLSQPFTIARGTKEKVSNVFVRLQAEGIEGFGEAGPNARYDEDAETVAEFIERIPGSFFDDIDDEGDLIRKLDALSPMVQSARVAVEMAWLDWMAKKQEVPLWKFWEAPADYGPISSYTIGLDSIDVMMQKIEDASEYPVYKIKLGTDRDKDIIRNIRKVTDKPIRVDANEGWTTLDEAKDFVRFLADHDIELVEQPMPAAQFNDMIKLKTFSPLPIGADESFIGDESLEDIAKAFDVINIKLMKIGSMVRARRVIEKARQLDLEIMIGCMIESSLGNTAGAILSLWADYADLDGHLLIKDDPFSGLTLNEQKRILINDKPGLGVELKPGGGLRYR